MQRIAILQLPSVCAPEWGVEKRPQQHKNAPSVSFQPQPKPERSEYPRGAAGQLAFHMARAMWFERKKGFALEGL